MGFDPVIWNPRIGDTGDDVYDVPGATRMSGSVDPGEPTSLQAGDASGFSFEPTLDQINRSSHFNQWVGAYNRRAAQAVRDVGFNVLAASNTTPIIVQIENNLSFGSFPNRLLILGCQGNTAANGMWDVTPIDTYRCSLNGSSGNGAYTGGGKSGVCFGRDYQYGFLTYRNLVLCPYLYGRISAGSGGGSLGPGMSYLRDCALTLRSVECAGNTAYAFPAIASGQIIRGWNLGHLRKALRISGHYFPENRYTQYSRLGSSSEAFGSVPGYSNSYVVGKTVNSYRARVPSAFRIPTWYGDLSAYIQSAAVKVSASLGRNTEGFQILLYRSATSDFPFSLEPAFAGSAYHTNFIDGTIEPSGALQYIPISIPAMVAKAGSYLNFIEATNTEVAGIGPTNNYANVAQPSLDVDFGA
jgi:hypothetical protein